MTWCGGGGIGGGGEDEKFKGKGVEGEIFSVLGTSPSLPTQQVGGLSAGVTLGNG